MKSQNLLYEIDAYKLDFPKTQSISNFLNDPCTPWMFWSFFIFSLRFGEFNGCLRHFTEPSITEIGYISRFTFISLYRRWKSRLERISFLNESVMSKKRRFFRIQSKNLKRTSVHKRSATFQRDKFSIWLVFHLTIWLQSSPESKLHGSSDNTRTPSFTLFF